MTEMTVLNGVAIEELLTIPMAVEAVEQAYLEKSKGDAALWPMVFHEFDPGHADLDIKSGDLGGLGFYGLMKAIDNFDVNQPVRFSTYGVPMIVGEIRRYLRDNSAMRVSRSMRDTAYKVLRAREALMAENQREPTVEQLAQYLGIPREEVVFAMDAISDPVSLYEPLYADSGDPVCVMDQVKDEKGTDDSWLDRIALKDAIARLDPRQQSILALRFCQGKTQMEVSSEIGISQAQVSRLEKTALGSIRKNM